VLTYTPIRLSVHLSSSSPSPRTCRPATVKSSRWIRAISQRRRESQNQIRIQNSKKQTAGPGQAALRLKSRATAGSRAACLSFPRRDLASLAVALQAPSSFPCSYPFIGSYRRTTSVGLSTAQDEAARSGRCWGGADWADGRAGQSSNQARTRRDHQLRPSFHHPMSLVARSIRSFASFCPFHAHFPPLFPMP